ncbi:unnamed protein product [Paramecium octaurelia]|uniref:Uncharacterized protein n=1 Tax=Paramecium octaurelia TaxID=43137 RepID=A0A8S1X352_PAROT|nr:unnamed protein product [Paramecium octaurelia]
MSNVKKTTRFQRKYQKKFPIADSQNDYKINLSQCMKYNQFYQMSSVMTKNGIS